MSVRERCSCGSEFESDEHNAVRLWREWRKEHVCQPSEPEYRDAGTTLSSVETVADGRYPELRMGFRGDEDFD